MKTATKLKMPKGGHPSGYSEWWLEGEPNRWRFCKMLPASGEIDTETACVWGHRGFVLQAARFGSCVGLFEELPNRPA